MKKTLVAIICGVAFASMSSIALADSCHGNCGTEGSGGTVNNQGGAGGAGGNGGLGVGVGIGIGQGGKGGSANQHQGQGQQQGQLQGQKQTSWNKNSNKNSNRNNNRSSASASNSGNNSSQSTNVTMQGDQNNYPDIPVSTAYAPTIAPTAICMGASSAGGSGPGLSLSFGTSWTDKNCMLLEQVRTTSIILNEKDVAAQMMCSIKEYADARAVTGHPCITADRNKKVAVAIDGQPIVATDNVDLRKKFDYYGNDPIVMRRYGMKVALK